MVSYLVIGQILIAASLGAFVYGNTSGATGGKAVKAVGYGCLLLGLTFIADHYMGLV